MGAIVPYLTKSESPIVSAHRVLLMGPPNVFKTTSIIETWPKPLHIQVYPGERGDATIPRDREDVKLYIWRDSTDPSTKASSADVVNQTETVTWEILAGKYGPVTSFSGDGIHKYYAAILNWVTGGASGKGEEFEPRLYARAHEHFTYYLQRVMASPVENVVFTCWDGKEADNPELKSQGPSHIFPDLPGKMAKRIMGEFSVVVYAIVDYAARQPNKPVPAKWQLLPEGKVWGAAVKAPTAVVMNLPVYIPQSYQALKQALEAAYVKTQATPKP